MPARALNKPITKISLHVKGKPHYTNNLSMKRVLWIKKKLRMS